MKGSARGTALMEFALAWPVVVLLVLGAVQVAIWESEVSAAHDAALAGARAGTVAGAEPNAAARVATRVMSSSVVGASVSVWCRRDARPAPPGIRVCATDLGATLRVEIDGSVPLLVPVFPAGGLPIRAHVVLVKETFAR